MKYRIAIPSFNRVNEIGNRTLAMLKKYDIDIKIIDIFVNTEDDLIKYKELYPEYNLILGQKGMKEIREFIFNYYNEGELVLFVDDDIDDILMKNPKAWEASSYSDDKVDLKQEIVLAFDTLKASGAGLWGVYPVKNHYFMRNSITEDLKFCSGGFFGVIIDKDCGTLKVNQYEDYERTIRYYKKYGKVIRLNYLCMDTKMYVNKGGMNDDKEERKKISARDLGILVGDYYEYVNVKKKKGNVLNPFLREL